MAIETDPIIQALATAAQVAQERKAAAAAAAADRRAELVRLRALAAEKARVYQLAFWPDDERAMPGDFIACALFTASKATNYVKREALASINGLTVIFTGKRLTQVHADVWMGIMHLARESYEESIVRFRGRELLELIGRYTHQSQREQLKGWIAELQATSVLVQTDAANERFGGSLLPEHVERDGLDDDSYAIRISRELAKALSGNHWRIDWQLRKSLRNKPLALWLQTYFSRFTRPVQVTQLHSLSGSTAKLKMFRHHLGKALADLHAAGGQAASIDREADTVIRARVVPPSKPRRPSHEGQRVLPFLVK